MKLYVWHGVFNDWTPGIAFAVANTKKEAIEVIVKERGLWPEDDRKELNTSPCQIFDLKDRKRALGFSQSGGG